jgi:4-hydroxy-2-oxoheptanedioate aldolase
VSEPRHHSWIPSAGVAVGVHVSFPTPEWIECLGLLGFDWIFLDAEHAPLDVHRARDLVRAADVTGIPVLVRIPEISAPLIESFLDIGVRGILAADVRTEAQAHRLVAAVRFPPRGTRGAAARSRAAHYGLKGSPADFIRHAHEGVLIAALLESVEGLDRLDAIAAVPGLDALAVGISDLALSMGATDAADPRVQQTFAAAERRIKASGKHRVAVVSSLAQGEEQTRAGANLIAVSDLALLCDAGRAFLAGIRALPVETAASP